MGVIDSLCLCPFSRQSRRFTNFRVGHGVVVVNSPPTHEEDLNPKVWSSLLAGARFRTLPPSALLLRGGTSFGVSRLGLKVGWMRLFRLY